MSRVKYDAHHLPQVGDRIIRTELKPEVADRLSYEGLLGTIVSVEHYNSWTTFDILWDGATRTIGWSLFWFSEGLIEKWMDDADDWQEDLVLEDECSNPSSV